MGSGRFRFARYASVLAVAYRALAKDEMRASAGARSAPASLPPVIAEAWTSSPGTAASRPSQQRAELDPVPKVTCSILSSAYLPAAWRLANFASAARSAPTVLASAPSPSTFSKDAVRLLSGTAGADSRTSAISSAVNPSFLRPA